MRVHFVENRPYSKKNQKREMFAAKPVRYSGIRALPSHKISPIG